MKIFIELAVVGLIAYGIWHEEALVAFEDKLIYRVKKSLKKAYRRIHGWYLEVLRSDLRETL